MFLLRFNTIVDEIFASYSKFHYVSIKIIGSLANVLGFIFSKFHYVSIKIITDHFTCS